MKALKELAYASMLLLASCTVQEEMKELTIDFETKVPLEVVEEHLQIDSLVCISANGCFISRFDKMIPSGDYIYVLDTMQDVVFKIDMPPRRSADSLTRLVLPEMNTSALQTLQWMSKATCWCMTASRQK